MAYVDYLKEKDWFTKCNEILNRDTFHCIDCGCLGFHNGGNFLELKNIEEIDIILKDYVFDVNPIIKEKVFSEFYKTIIQYDASINRIRSFEFKSELTLDYGDISLCHFKKPYNTDYTTGTDYFPILIRKNQKPMKIIQRKLDRFTNVSNNEDRPGNFYEFIFPDCTFSSIYICLEQYNHADYVTIQLDNKLFALVFASYKHLFKGLNIHHNYYIEGYRPWQYNNSALVTLCEECHKKRHEKEKIPIKNKTMIPIAYTTICDRCSGSGYLPQYKHFEHGICFKCGGEGVLLDP